MGNRRTIDLTPYLSPRVSPGLSTREPPLPGDDELPAEKRMWKKLGMAVGLLNELLGDIQDTYLQGCSSAYQRACREQEYLAAERAKGTLILAMNRLRIRREIPDDED